MRKLLVMLIIYNYYSKCNPMLLLINSAAQVGEENVKVLKIFVFFLVDFAIFILTF